MQNLNIKRGERPRGDCACEPDGRRRDDGEGRSAGLLHQQRVYDPERSGHGGRRRVHDCESVDCDGGRIRKRERGVEGRDDADVQAV